MVLTCYPLFFSPELNPFNRTALWHSVQARMGLDPRINDLRAVIADAEEIDIAMIVDMPNVWPKLIMIKLPAYLTTLFHVWYVIELEIVVLNVWAAGVLVFLFT